MYVEVENQAKTIQELNKKLQFHETELEYLRNNDRELREELKSLKTDHTQKIRILRKTEKELNKLV